jgi:hypothetical protein
MTKIKPVRQLEPGSPYFDGEPLPQIFHCPYCDLYWNEFERDIERKRVPIAEYKACPDCENIIINKINNL